MGHAGVEGNKQSPRRRVPLVTAFAGAAIAALGVMPRTVNASCAITNSGTVACNADTITTKTTNIDGARPSSSARTQWFHNGSAITGSIQSGTTLSGFGLQLTEKPGGKNTQEPITVNNQGEVTTGKAVDALQLSGDGGSLTTPATAASVTRIKKTPRSMSRTRTAVFPLQREPAQLPVQSA